MANHFESSRSATPLPFLQVGTAGWISHPSAPSPGWHSWMDQCDEIKWSWCSQEPKYGTQGFDQRNPLTASFPLAWQQPMNMLHTIPPHPEPRQLVYSGVADYTHSVVSLFCRASSPLPEMWPIMSVVSLPWLPCILIHSGRTLFLSVPH